MSIQILNSTKAGFYYILFFNRHSRSSLKLRQQNIREEDQSSHKLSFTHQKREKNRTVHTSKIWVVVNQSSTFVNPQETSKIITRHPVNMKTNKGFHPQRPRFWMAKHVKNQVFNGLVLDKRPQKLTPRASQRVKLALRGQQCLEAEIRVVLFVHMFEGLLKNPRKKYSLNGTLVRPKINLKKQLI